MQTTVGLHVLKMDQMNPVNNSVSPASAPPKRKRGRPRKERSPYLPENTPAPPGFFKVNGTRARRVEANQFSHDHMVGQAVSGFIEAAFDAGYLLNVRVGNSASTLRGVVFKPGHFVPISADNDVAPDVPMVRRNEVPFSSQQRGGRREPHAKRHRSVNDLQAANQLAIVTPPTANRMTLQSKQDSRTQPGFPELIMGTVVPVVLQPANLANGIPPVFPAPHLTPSIIKQPPPFAITGLQKEGNQFPEAVGKPGSLQLLGEVVNGIHASSKLGEMQMENSKFSDRLSARDMGFSAEAGVANMDSPLSVDPIQAVHPNHNQTISVQNPIAEDRTGRLSQLLQVVQENMTENQHYEAQQSESSATDTDEERMDEEPMSGHDHISPNNHSSGSSG